MRVADREADLYEYLCDCRARSHGFMVRAAYDRVLLDAQTEQRNGQYLLSFARTLAVGRLGGHMNRKGDRLPGWQTLWRGMTRLATLVEGYRLGRNRFGE